MPSGSGCSGVCCDLTSPGLHINDNDGEFRGNHTKSVFFFQISGLGSSTTTVHCLSNDHARSDSIHSCGHSCHGHDIFSSND